MNFNSVLPFLFFLLSPSFALSQQDTFPGLDGSQAPANLDEMWRGFDPRSEPLETEIPHEWEEDGVVLKVVRFRIGVFKGTTARLAAIYGYPKAKSEQGVSVPGLVQIHGGGQYADYKACLTNAKRGYATVSIAWAGRISAPEYRVGPNEVQLFWDGSKDNPRYRETTDWGAVDGYHAPGRNAGNQFPSAKPAAWTLDEIESPRNSGWFLCAVAARRALTFLEHQPEVDADRLGVYGHSMGGKLTVLTAIDSRVKAAAPSCGGISDRYNSSELFRVTLGDDVSLKRISCPIIFLSPANDFHGRIVDLPDAVSEIQSQDWRVTCSPHHNHQDTAPYEVATQLWFDQHLKSDFQLPRTPQTALSLQTEDGIPTLQVIPDTGKPILSVDVFSTQAGNNGEQPPEMSNPRTRFWQHSKAVKSGNHWTARLPLASTKKPLWVYANVEYGLEKRVSGAGYYYRVYEAESINVSSLLLKISADELTEAGSKPTREPSLLIEDFEGDWKKEWFSYRPENWALTTNKLTDPMHAAPEQAALALEVRCQHRNTLVVTLDDFGNETSLEGGLKWQALQFTLTDFQNLAGEFPVSWSDMQQLKLSDAEHLKPARGSTLKRKLLGANWKGDPPEFRNLRWIPLP